MAKIKKPSAKKQIVILTKQVEGLRQSLNNQGTEKHLLSGQVYNLTNELKMTREDCAKQVLEAQAKLASAQSNAAQYMGQFNASTAEIARLTDQLNKLLRIPATNRAQNGT